MSGRIVTSGNGVERYNMYRGTGRRHVSSHRQIDISDMRPVLAHQSSHTSHGGGSTNHNRGNSQPIGGNSKRMNSGKDTFLKRNPKQKTAKTYNIPIDMTHGSRTSYTHSRAVKSHHGNHTTGSVSETVPIQDDRPEAKYVDMGRKRAGPHGRVNFTNTHSYPEQSSKSSKNGAYRKQSSGVAIHSSGISKQGKWGNAMLSEMTQKTEGLPEVQNKHQPQLTSRNNLVKPRQRIQLPVGSELDLGRQSGYLDTKNYGAGSTHIGSYRHEFSHDTRPALAHHSSHTSHTSPRHTQRIYDHGILPSPRSEEDMDLPISSHRHEFSHDSRPALAHHSSHASTNNLTRHSQKTYDTETLILPGYRQDKPINIMMDGDGSKLIGLNNTGLVQRHQAAHPSNSLPRQTMALPGSKQSMDLPTKHDVDNMKMMPILHLHQAAHPSNRLSRHSQINTSLVDPRPDSEVHTQNNDSVPGTKNGGTRSDPINIFEDPNSLSLFEIPHQASHTRNNLSRRN